MVKSGIVGMRIMGNRYVEILSQTSEARLIAVVDIDSTKLEESTHRYRTSAYHDYADMY